MDKTKNCLAFVVVYNLPRGVPPANLRDFSLVGLTREIVDAISSQRKEKDVAEENVAFSLLEQLDNSPGSALMPLTVDVSLFSEDGFKPGFIEHGAIALEIWKGVQAYVKKPLQTRMVIVIVRRPNGTFTQYSGF